MSRHSHYHKDVTHLKSIDVYRTLELFGVTDQALGHAIKKLLCAGKRGAGKTFEQDVREAVDTLNRRLQMLAEDDAPKDFGVPTPKSYVAEGWTEASLPHAPWAEGTRLDFLLVDGTVQKGVGYVPKMSLLFAKAWRFSDTPVPPASQSDESAPGAATHWCPSSKRWIAKDTDGGWSEFRSNYWFTLPEYRTTIDWVNNLQPIAV